MKIDSVEAFNDTLPFQDQKICHALREIFDRGLPEAECKIWHAHPVWFLAGNPIVGYSKLKSCVRVMFWSGQSFVVSGLERTSTFKAAEIRYTAHDQVNAANLERWIHEARHI